MILSTWPKAGKTSRSRMPLAILECASIMVENTCSDENGLYCLHFETIKTVVPKTFLTAI
jgi:hypothetical protein